MNETFNFPGQPVVTDGCGAVVWVDTHAINCAAVYPITSSSPMGAGFQEAVANGKHNVWGEPLAFLEPESEHSSASACEGMALAGGRVSNFTSGQGLILMKEVLYTIAGKRLPVVFQIGARALTIHSLNVHAGHDDVMGIADCGWGMLFARNAQEAADFALIARKTAEASYTPFFNIQDGFLTTHTVENVRLPEPELIKTYLQDPANLVSFIDPNNPMMSGTVQNQDAYMRGRVAQRAFYEPIKDNLLQNMEDFYQLTGRKYGLIDCYQMEDADYAIVGMGSFMETAKATVRTVRKQTNEKVGCVSVLSFRPFPGRELVEALKGVKVISVLERLDECSAAESPLAREIKAAFADAHWEHPDFPRVERMPIVQHGAGGLGGNDVRVRDIQAIIANMKLEKQGKVRYCVNILHPDALPYEEEMEVFPKGYFAMRGYSVGGFGSITTNKMLASISAELFPVYVQAYPKYGAEKKGLPTTFYLALSPEYIETHQPLHRVNFVVINGIDVFYRENPLSGIVPGGVIFLQASETDPQIVWNKLPLKAQQAIRDNQLQLYIVDAAKIAREVAHSSALATRMRGVVLLGVFLKLTPMVKDFNINEENMYKAVEQVLKKYLGKKGEQTLADNLACVKRGFNEVIKIPCSQ